MSVQSTRTDALGGYTFDALPTGSYHIEFSAYNRAIRFSGDSATSADASTITVTKGSVTTAVNATLALAPRGTIHGTVTTAGKPDWPLTVQAIAVSDGEVVSTTTTGTDGKFFFRGLSYVPYRVLVSDPAGQLRPMFWGASSGNLLGTELTPTGEAWLEIGTQAMVGRDCDLSAYTPGINLAGKNLTNLNLTGCDLAGDNLTNADLTGTNVTGANLNGATITGVTLTDTVLTGTVTGALTGSPAVLPTNWIVANGYLVGPGANLVNADLSGANLANVDLTGADVSGAVFTGANLTGLVTKETYGPPATLPPGWVYVRFSMPWGYLVGPGANLAGANLSTPAFISVLTGADLRGTSLSNANLTGMIFTNIDLTGADLSGATLTGATLTSANFTGVDLTGVASGSIVGYPAALPGPWRLIDGYLVGPGANLAGDDLSGLDLSGVDLSNADLTGANLTNVKLAGANVTNAKLLGATTKGVTSGSLVGVPTCVVPSTITFCMVNGYLIEPGVNLSRVDLSGSRFDGVDLSGADLSNTDLSGAELMYSNFTGVDFSNADFTGAHISYPDSKFDYANLAGADLTNSTISSVSLVGANLAGTNFQGATFDHLSSGAIKSTPTNLPAAWRLVSGYLVGPTAQLNGANLSHANLWGVNLDAASLNGANLSHANLGWTRLTNVQMYNADLTGANLNHSNLYRAVLEGDQLTGTILTAADFSQVYFPLVRSGAVTGTPAMLPPNWTISNGYLIGPDADLSAEDLTGLDFSGVDLTSVDFHGANLTGASFWGAVLTGVKSGGITSSAPTGLAHGWQFTGGYLVGPGADLTGANLAEVDLTGVNLTGADLRHADLTGANLEGASLVGATLTGVISGGITGTPAALPTGWSLVNGELVQSTP